MSRRVDAPNREFRASELFRPYGSGNVMRPCPSLIQKVLSARRSLPFCKKTSVIVCCRQRLANRCYSDVRDSGQQSTLRATNGSFPSRTHQCGILNTDNDGEEVILAGWLQTGRKSSKHLFFSSLKDSTGAVQLVVRPSSIEGNAEVDIANIPEESVVLIRGRVKARPESARKPGPSGDVEVHVKSYQLLNPVEGELPFSPSDTENLPGVELRARYRHLDLRRDGLKLNVHKRAHVTQLIRNRLYEQGFIDVETPILLNSTPEGAREYVVPTRVRRVQSDPSPSSSESTRSGSSFQSSPAFYALAQSPQQPKQLLVCSGAVDKYFQFAKCFRDEDGRKDRQPEFTQLDMEMAFVSWHGSEDDVRNGWRIGGSEVKAVIEDLVRRIWRRFESIELPEVFPVMTYQDAMSNYGSDKPDTRFGLEIRDITGALPTHLSRKLKAEGDVLEYLSAHRNSPFAYRPEDSIDTAQLPAGVLAVDSDGFDGDTTLESELRSAALAVREALCPQPGDVLYLARRSKIAAGGSTALGRLRLQLRDMALSRKSLTLQPEPHFLWVTEFPLFTRADEDKDFLAKGRWSSSHHPFTAPMSEDLDALMSGDLEKVRGQHYDLVLNGLEIGGGSVRIHDAALQEMILRDVLELTSTEVTRFAHLLHALRCGAPPHGGIALGFDRLMSILCHTDTIRDVIAFPKTSGGRDLLFGSPSPAIGTALEDYGLRPLEDTARSTT